MKLYEEFIEYLNDQVGQPYVWSGQHTKLTPDSYEAVIEKKEAKTGSYDGGPTYSEAAKAFCKEKFDAGAEVLYAYDCSGLGVYWLYNVKKIYKGDCNANTMMNRCELRDTDPKCGYWVFKVGADGKANHVGYMVSDTEVIEAKGRKFGVVKSAFKAKNWDKWGVPAVFKEELEPDDPPAPTEYAHVKIVGGSVHIRDGGTTDYRVLHTAHKGEIYDRFGEDAPSGWYGILWRGQQGYISNKEKYTKLIE